jgi:hypothetical protein
MGAVKVSIASFSSKAAVSIFMVQVHTGNISFEVLMLSKIFATFSMLGVLLLTSCATTAPDQEVDRKNGAKRGWIDKFYMPDSLVADLPGCLASTSPTDLATKHFVKIYYRHVRQMFSTIAELPDELQPKLNDQVEFWPGDCSNGKVSHIKRIIPSAS